MLPTGVLNLGDLTKISVTTKPVLEKNFSNCLDLFKATDSADDVGSMLRPTPEVGGRVPRVLAAFVAVVVVAAYTVVFPAPAQAAPTLSVVASGPASVLQGGGVAYSLRACNPSGPDTYNLSLRTVLPAGVSYVSTTGTTVAPRILANLPTTGLTTLIWDNVADLQTGVCQSIGLNVSVDAAVNPVGTVLSVVVNAYSNTDARTLVKFNPDGTVQAATAPGSGTSGAVNTTVIPYKLTKAGGGELMRGVHSNPNSWTLTLTNNTIAPTSAFVVDDFLPPNLELLGCATTDNTAAGIVEYIGAPRLAPVNCVYTGALGAPAVSVTTLDGATPVTRADGSTTTPPIGTTWVRWTFPASGGSSALAAGGVETITYRAGIPLRENRPFGGTAPTPASGLQGANLDNNTGPWTEEAPVSPSTLADGGEQSGTNQARSGATYTGPKVIGAPTTYGDSDTTSFQAEDLQMSKASAGTVIQGSIITNTLTVRASEYRRVNNITVTDRLPDGTCPMGEPAPSNPECTTANPPTATVNGTPVTVNAAKYTSVTLEPAGSYLVTWDSTTIPALASLAPNDVLVLTQYAKVRTTYQSGNQVQANDSMTNHSFVNGALKKEVPGDTAPPTQLGIQADGQSIQDDASAPIAGIPVTLSKTVATKASLTAPVPTNASAGATCLGGAFVAGPASGYATGDVTCFKLRATVPPNVASTGLKVVDFLPDGMKYIVGSARTTAANNITIPNPTAPPGTSPEPDVSGVSPTTGGGLLEWTIGAVANSGRVFEVVIAVELVDPNVSQAGDLTDNLLKLTSVNSAGTIFPLRVNTGVIWSEPELTLRKGIDKIERPTIASPSYPADYTTTFTSSGPDQGDNSPVQSFDHVTYRVDLTNPQNLTAKNVVVWDKLPQTPVAITCAEVVTASISGGGSCVAAPFPHIEWTVATINVGDTPKLTYRVAMPTGMASGSTETNTAGITSYTSPINTGGNFTYVPASNLDATKTPNMTKVLNDTATVIVFSPTPVKTVTAPTCSGAGCVPDVRVGDPIAYRVTVDLPRTKVIDGHVLDSVPNNVSNVTWTAKLERGAADITAGNLTTTSGSGNSIDVPLVDPFDNTASVGVITRLTLTINGRVANVAGNTDGFHIANTARFSSRPIIAGAPVVLTSPAAIANVTVPNVGIAKAVFATSPVRVPQKGVLATDTVTYELTLANTGTGPAYRVVLNDVVPTNLTPNPASILIDGAAISGSDSASFTGSTLNATIDQIAAGASKKVRYTVTVDSPVTPSPLASAGLTNTATLSQYQTLPTDAANPDIRVISPGSTSTQTVYPLSKLGDLVWKDLNGNGTRDAGDVGLAIPGGVTVTLSGTDVLGNAVNRTTTSNATTGMYSFDDLMPSNGTGYLVTFARPSGLYFSPKLANTPTSSDTDSDAAIANGQTARVVVGSNADIKTVDAGLYEPAVVGNFIWKDLNADGIQDAGEGGLGGATVSITDSSGNPVKDGLGNTVASFVTTASGAYSFGAMPPGTYQIKVVPPAGYTLSPNDRLADDTVDSDVIAATGRTSSVTVVPGETNNTLDAGYFRSVTIGDQVWLDANADGVRQGGETTGLAGVAVTLRGAGIDGFFGTADDITGSTTTDASGLYSFTKSGVNNVGAVLPPGDYRVTFGSLSTYELSPAAVGAPKSSGTDSDAGTGTGVTQTFTMVDNESTVNVDAGMFQRASISNFVWEDLNANGVQDGGEPGVDGVTVELLDSSGASFTTPVTTTTAGGGLYSFANLLPATYRVKFTPPTAAWQFSPTGAGTTATDSNPVPLSGTTGAITLTSGQNNTTIDAGIYRFATLGDQVWEDVNGNGVREAGDNGLVGVTVRLLDSAGNPVLNGATPITTTTGAGGIYSFTNLVPGTYRIKVDYPGGYAATVYNAAAATDANDSDIARATGQSDAVTLVSNETNLTLDAGLFKTSSIGDLIWVDTNGNGVRDGAEAGIAGVTVRLVDSSGNGVTDASGATVANITTTSTGAYSFPNLWPGDYRVVIVSKPAGYQYTTPFVTINGGTPTNDSNTDPATSRSNLITLTSGTDDPTIDTGLARPVVIGNQVWIDTNANGVHDGAEISGLPGVTVTLTGAGLDGVFGTADDVTGTATTDSGGNYQFTRTGVSNAGNLLVAGDYRVTFTPLGGALPYELSPVSASLPKASDLDSDADTTAGPTLGRTATFTMLEGTSTTFVDAGMFQRTALGNFVWEDLNANGIQDSGETGVTGVTVELLDASGNPLATPVTTTTASNGAWSFTNLIPANYRVKFTPPTGAGWQFSPTGAGTAATDSNPTPGSGSATTPVFTLDSGVTDNTVDSGLYRLATLGNFVWDDLNGDGIQDGGEPGIGNVTVTLTGTTGSGSPVTATTTTAIGTGAYQFANLIPGSYRITVTLPSGRVVTVQDASTATEATDSDISRTTRQSANVTLISNQTFNDLDAGLYTPATLGNRVWRDDNADGIQTAGEDGIAGVTVRLVDAADNAVVDASGRAVASVVTDSVGGYTFANLWPGSYRVLFTAPNGYIFTDTLVTTGGATTATDSNADANGRSNLTTLQSGDVNTSVDAGLFKGVTIGDQAWEDTNADGIHQASETTGVGGITVELRNSAGTVVATTTTDSNGNYLFTRLGTNNAGALLRQGDYSVHFGRPAGYTGSPASAATPRASGLDSDADPTTGITPDFTMADGASTDHIDAGFYRTASLGDRVWQDTNANGVQDSGEPGLDGATVELLDATGSVVATQVTSSGGAFLFTSLLPGSYKVRFAAPAGSGWNPSPTGAGTPATDSDANVSTHTTLSVTITSGSAVTTLDAGYFQYARLGNFVWEDSNGNGLQDLGEPGAANVRVHLLDAAGTPVLDGSGTAITTTTNGTGAYQFANLVPGVYKIRIDAPAGFTLTAANVGANNAVDSDLNKVTGLSGSTTLASGETNNTLDAGIVNLPIISGYSYVDADNDGIRDSGEAPIAGVTIRLTGIDSHGQAVNITTTSGADGYYQFAGLEPSDATGYTVTETQPAGFIDGQDTVGSAGGTIAGPAPTRDVISGVVVGSSTNAQRYNFGELRTASIAGAVYVDVTNDGNRQAGEQGIVGVTITLSGTDDLGNAVTATATTAADGSYSFGGLRPGTYAVTEPTQPSGYLDGAERAGSSGGVTTTNDRISAITLASGDASVNNLFGERPTSPVAYTSISGAVRIDPNANGTRDPGENGTIAGVTITLRNSNGDIVATTTTDINGNYAFSGVPVGDYTIEQTQPTGYGSSSTNTISVSAPVGGLTAQDFFETTSTLSGFVYVDADNDGVFNGGERPIGNVSIRVTGTDVNGKPVNVSTTTSADGSWSVTGLVAGTYVVTETQPAGYGDGKDAAGSLGGTVSGTGIGTDRIAAITVGAAQNGTAYNFGEVRSTATISGLVYVDHDRDSTRDAVDGAIGSVTIILRDGLGNEIARTTTASDGSYLFANLTLGDNYRIDQVTPAGYGRSEHPATITVTALPATGVANQNFGDTLSSLSGSTYVDLDNDGVHDSGEPAISGVTVTLTGTDAAGHPVSRTTISSSTGAWAFNDLLAGSYAVTETQPSGYVDGKDTAGSEGGTVTNDRVAAITVPTGTDATGYLFGERLNTTSLSGTVWNDLDGDGVIDAGENGIGGVTLTLKDSNGNTVGTTTTNPDGTYTFTNLVPGTYSVVETQPAGYGSSTPNTLSTLTVPIDGLSGANFGETTGSISGRAYVATTNDGVRQSGETTAIGGVTMTLTGTDANGPVTRTTTTDVLGLYRFAGLLAGTYTVAETQPAGYTDAVDSRGTIAGNPVGTLGNDVVSNIVLPAAAAGIDYDFAETQTAPAGAFVSGTVYLDKAGNGSIDTGDTGLGGWTIELLNNAGTVVATVTTAADGTYLFTNLGTNNTGAVLPAGVYSVRETQKTTHGSSTPNLIADLNVPPTGRPNQNFGETLSSLSGRVVVATTDDGVADAGEAGISGVTITLSGTDVLGTTVTRTTTTSADGSYSFTDLPAGTYSVVETQPSAYNDGADHAGSAGGTLTPTDTISSIVVPTATAAAGYDFGELVRSTATGTTLSGTVYFDRNRSGGVPGTGETGIGGVTLTLFDSLGAVVATTTTAPDGTYSFANIRPGTYRVVETQPNGLGSTTPNTLSALTVLAGGLTDVNFGEIGSSMAGQVYIDSNDNGTRQAPGEGPIAGVTVTLAGTDVNNAAVTRTAVTAPDGSYSFDDLLGGVYTVTETQPSTYLDGTDKVGTITGPSASAAPGTLGNDVISAISLPVEAVGTGYDFGEKLRPTPAGTAFLEGIVWNDANGSTTINPGENGLAGVLITLRDSGGAVVATALTGPDGRYRFDGLAIGTYTVVETQPSGYTSTTPDSIVSANVIATGLSNQNFGEKLATGTTGTTTTLSGVVWIDRNGSTAIDSGEPGLGGVLLTLIDANGNPVATTTTAPDGSYVFTNLVPGTYSVSETQPAAYGSSTPNLVSALVVPARGLTGINFGETAATISGSVYVDADGNGIRAPSAAEHGIGGVVISLTGIDVNGVPVNATTTTAPDGSYAFTGLPAGTYSVFEAQPAGYLDGADTAGSTGTAGPDTITSIVVDPGGASIGHIFGEQEVLPTVVYLRGVVFLDRDRNANAGPGDAVLPGVTVQLRDASGAVVGTTVTLPDGSYLFAGVTPGLAYTVVELQPVGYGSSLRPTNSIAVIAPPTGGLSGLDFGDTLSAISGSVYHDVNNDGVRDLALGNSEVGIGGVPVTITGTTAAGLAVMRTVLTTPDGSYAFTDLPAGVYSLAETQPPAWADGKDAAGTNGGGTAVSDQITDIELPVDVLASGYVFGERVPAATVTTTISGVVFVDRGADGRTPNGTREGGEPGIGGVTLILRDAAGVEIARTTTAPDGTYTFIRIAPGTYTVEEVQPVNYGTSTPNLLGSLVVPETGLGGVDFGETLGAASGVVFSDANNNGVQDAGEPGIAGATVTLTGKDAANNAVTRTVTTAADGTYAFTDLLPSDPAGYSIVETQPTGWFDGRDDSSINGLIGDDAVTAVIIQPGQQIPVGRFGELAPVALGDRVWDDLNGNGIQDAGEPGINGVTVTLNGIDDRGNAVTRTTATSSVGGWFIDNLRPGTYTLTFAKPGMKPTATTVAGSTPVNDSDATGNGTTASFTLHANVDLLSHDADDLTRDAGLYTPVRLGDFVWRDDNENGRQDAGEPGVGGVTVSLLHAGPDGRFGTADDRTTTTVTDGTGHYSFADLAPGNVRVIVPLPTHYAHSPVGADAGDPLGAGPDAAVDSNIDPITEWTEVTLVSGHDRPDVDAGLVPLGSLGGRVWDDGNERGDEVQTPSDRGVDGIGVHLLHPDGFPVLGADGQPRIAVTDSDGNYLFLELLPGDYVVRFDIPTTRKGVHKGVGTPTTDSDMDPTTLRTGRVTVRPLEDVRHVDAGTFVPTELVIVLPVVTTASPTTTVIAPAPTTSTTVETAPTTTRTGTSPITPTTSIAGSSRVPSGKQPTTSSRVPRAAVSGTPAAVRNESSTVNPSEVESSSVDPSVAVSADRPTSARVGGRAEAHPGDGLALTGADVLRLLGIAAALFGAGAVLTLGTRRRRRAR